MRVGITAHLDDAAMDLCRRAFATDTLYRADRTGGAPAWDESFAACEVMFGTIPAAWIPRLTALRWLQLESVGYEYYRDASALIRQRDIRVTNLEGQFAHPAAETVIAGILSLTRGLDELSIARQERRWRSLEIRPTTSLLARSTAVVLGAGSIGRQVRQVLEAFGCRVLTFARRSLLAELHGTEQLDAVLPECDLVIGCLPSTPATRMLLHRDRIAALPPTAIVANVGRGSLIDEDALAEALDSGRLGGAVLDVTHEEPLPVDHPLWTTPRTILTQHTGGGHREELIDKARFFAANAERFRAGEQLRGLVDCQLEY